MKRKLIGQAIVLALGAASAFGQYKLEPAGAPPSELTPPIGALIQDKGHKIVAGSKVLCEVWFVKAVPTGPATTETDVMWKTVPLGAVVGAIRFPEGGGSDRRGQALKAGVYTMRFALQPVNGDHQGVAPQRDFLVLTPAAQDTDAAPVANVDALMNMTRKASGTPHPAVLSMWVIESDFKAGFDKAGESDWALQVDLGGVKIGLILVGKVEA